MVQSQSKTKLASREITALSAALQDGPPFSEYILTLLERYIHVTDLIILNPEFDQYVQQINEGEPAAREEGRQSLAHFLHEATLRTPEKRPEETLQDLTEGKDVSLDYIETIIDKVARENHIIETRTNDEEVDLIAIVRKEKEREGLEWDEALPDEQAARPFKKYQCVQLTSAYRELHMGSVGIVVLVLDSFVNCGLFYTVEVVNVADPVGSTVVDIDEKDLKVCSDPPEWYPEIVIDGYLDCEGYHNSKLPQKKIREIEGPRTQKIGNPWKMLQTIQQVFLPSK